MLRLRIREPFPLHSEPNWINIKRDRQSYTASFLKSRH